MPIFKNALAEELRLSTARREQAQERSNGRGFTGDIGADKAKNLPLFDRNGNVGNAAFLSIKLGQRLSFNDIHSGGWLNSFPKYDALRPHPIKFATNFLSHERINIRKIGHLLRPLGQR